MIHLQPDEVVETVVRKHWFVLAEQFTALFVLFLAPFVLARLVSSGTLPAPLLADALAALSAPTKTVLAASWALLFWVRFFAFYADHYLDAWIVTNKHLIDVEQKSFFHRDIATLALESIEDIAIEVRGLIPTLLSYGTIRVQTAAQSREFIMDHAPRPERVKEILLAARRKAAERAGAA